MSKLFLTSLGCRLNQAEMAALASSATRAGYSLVDKPERATVIVLNTCAVTKEAERKSRQLLRRLKRLNPKAQVIVTGCYAQLDPSLGNAEGAASIVVDNVSKQKLIEKPQSFFTPVNIAEEPAILTDRLMRTRAQVRIQEGCDNRCTYCIVWKLRGPQRSRPFSEVLAEVQSLVSEGYREVVLTGVHIGAYGNDVSGNVDLWRLVRLLLSNTDLRRLRLSSIEPWDARNIDLGLWEDVRLCRHLHLPLQSGSDGILRRMGRPYTTAEYASLLARIRAVVPDIAITTDIITGFPGESDSDFRQSLDFAASCEFARTHVFPYSERPGTAAASFPDLLPVSVRKERAAQIRLIAQNASRRYQDRFLGHTVEVLWETRRDGWWSGLTSNYLRVRTKSERALRNTISSVKIVGRDSTGLIGTFLEA